MKKRFVYISIINCFRTHLWIFNLKHVVECEIKSQYYFIFWITWLCFWYSQCSIPLATTILNFYVLIYITKCITIIVAYICKREMGKWREQWSWVCEETVRVGLEKHNVAVYGDALGKMVITGNLNVVSQTFWLIIHLHLVGNLNVVSQTFWLIIRLHLVSHGKGVFRSTCIYSLLQRDSSFRYVIAWGWIVTKRDN
jgi:hypothetical protein